MAQATPTTCNWLCAGTEFFSALLAAIDSAEKSVCLEVYIFTDSSLGKRFREALVRAQGRGARVRVLLDAAGSYYLPENFWQPLRDAGGEVRRFNPIAFKRLTIRDHRKLVVCDGKIAFVGGFNIASEYEGDGVNCGWCDLGMKVEGPMVAGLAASFEEMFSRAEFRHKYFIRLRKTGAKKSVTLPAERLLFSGPGWGRNPYRRALHQDLRRARSVQIIGAYFLPPWRLRRDLLRVMRRGGQVQLILPAKSDVPISLLAAQSLYRRLLGGKVEIYEYQPQILHAKLIIVDNIVYSGSSNLDTRSLQINYELMIRFADKDIVRESREIFAAQLAHCQPVTSETWRKSRTFWRRLKQRWAYFLLSRIDPYVARRQWRALPDE